MTAKSVFQLIDHLSGRRTEPITCTRDDLVSALRADHDALLQPVVDASDEAEAERVDKLAHIRSTHVLKLGDLDDDGVLKISTAPLITVSTLLELFDFTPKSEGV